MLQLMMLMFTWKDSLGYVSIGNPDQNFSSIGFLGLI